MNDAADRLTFARKARNLSRSELAARLKVTPGCIAQIELRHRGGGRDLWRRLAAALGTSTDWLLDGVGRPPAADGGHQASAPMPRVRVRVAKAS